MYFVLYIVLMSKITCLFFTYVEPRASCTSKISLKRAAPGARSVLLVSMEANFLEEHLRRVFSCW